MWKHVIWVLAMLVLLPVAYAQEDSGSPPKPDKPAPPATPAEQYQALQQEYAKAQAEFSKAYRAAETDEERQKVLSEKYPKPQEFVGRFMELAEAHPDDPAAVDALVWVVTTGRTGKEVEKAVDILATDHIESEKLGPVCQRLMYSGNPSAKKLLREVLEKSPHHQVQAHACFSLAKVMQRGGGEKAAKEAEELLERIVEEFDDVESFRGTLADAAKSELFELRFLGIGKIAPEIEGEDVDSVAFKLTDYRGKVVVLDFWGNW